MERTDRCTQKKAKLLLLLEVEVEVQLHVKAKDMPKQETQENLEK